MNKDEQQALNTKLADAAENGNLTEVTALLAKGADINGRHCLDGCGNTPLVMAAIKGHIPVIQYLLEKGADPVAPSLNGKSPVEHAKDNSKTEAATIISSALEEKSPDRVSFFTPVSDRVRHDIFDFSLKERVTLIRQGRYGTVETAAITGFSAIEDQSDTSMLRKAFNEHVKRGGTTEESQVFPSVFRKVVRPGLQKG